MSIIGNYIYKDDKWIGKGTFGTVYKAYKNNHPETIYALKKVDLKGLADDDKRHCYDEVKAMKDICHPNIIRFHDSFEHDNRFLVIIMEYCEIGNLKHYIRNSEKIPERECLEIAEQICSALKFLHKEGKIHRDVKTENIFLTKDKTVKLGDLALVRLIEKPGNLTKYCGSPLYMSPEMSGEKPYSYKTDIWSFGCCLYEIAMKKSPFSAGTETELRRKIGTENLKTDTFPYGEAVKALIKQMMQKNPDQRPNISQVADALNSLLHKPSAQDDTVDSDSEAYDIPPQMRDMPISCGSATFPGPRADYHQSEACRPRKKKSYRQRPLGSIRPVHDLSSSDDRGYSSSDTRDLRHKGEETKVINIPAKCVRDEKNSGTSPPTSPNGSNILDAAVEVTPEELDMMKFASDLESTLKRYLSSDEWQKMSSILTELSKEEPAVEEKFMERLAKVLRQEILAKVKPFLSSYWSFKMPLLKRTYKMAQTGS